MRVIWTQSGLPRFWLAPLMLGLVAIAAGVAIVLFPQLLAYAVAGLLVFVGLSLVVAALSMRTAAGRPPARPGWTERDEIEV